MATGLYLVCDPQVIEPPQPLRPLPPARREHGLQQVPGPVFQRERGPHGFDPWARALPAAVNGAPVWSCL